MFQKILLAYDGSESARRAAQLAKDLARRFQAEMRVVCCFDPIPPYLGDPDMQRALNKHIGTAERNMAEVVEAIGDEVDLRQEVLEGPAAEAILEVARTRESDLIVMGTRGMGRLSGLLMGSVSQKVVGHAPCPVLLTR